MKFILIFTVITTLINANFLYGSDHQEIYKLIKNYLEKNGIKNEFSINKKIRIPQCSKKLLLRKKFNSYKTVEIQCPQNNPWKYIIRTNLKNFDKKIKEKKNTNNKLVRLIKLNNNLRKGHKITKNDIYFEKTNVPGSSNYFTKESEVIGRKAKITIRKGQILRSRHIEKNWTLVEGQKVIIENNRLNIQILVDGVALQSAMLGDYTKVLNKSTGKIVQAWVKNNKKVSIFAK